jgi:hypothetical protein
VKPLLLAFLLLLGLAAPAAANQVSIEAGPDGGVRLGGVNTIAGAVTDDAGAPLAGREVRLEVRRHPFAGVWRRRATTTTDAAGAYAFRPELDRNHEVRVRLVGILPEADTLSVVRNVFVLPAFKLSFAQRANGKIRVRQDYTVPEDVLLTAPTRFYVGPCDLKGQRCTAKLAPLVAVAKTKQVRKGRYRATATVKIPARYEGRFQYVSCFTYSKGSGMGDPDTLTCPKRRARVG